jgi:uncharacterized membrane protein YfcA
MALFGLACGERRRLVMNVAVAALSLAFLRRPVRRRPLAACFACAGRFVGGVEPTSPHRPVRCSPSPAPLLWVASQIPGLPGAPLLVGIGAAIGLIAGLTGVGGGIFLSPLLLLTGWEETRRTAGASAAFILANSASGLVGHWSAGRVVPDGVALLTVVALAGGLVGSLLGAKKLAPPLLKRLLGAVLVIAAAFILVNLAVDLLYAYLDPRIRYD